MIDPATADWSFVVADLLVAWAEKWRMADCVAVEAASAGRVMAVIWLCVTGSWDRTVRRVRLA